MYFIHKQKTADEMPISDWSSDVSSSDLDKSVEFPKDFHRAMADGGWLGSTMPEEYGGTVLGVTEAMTMMNEVAACGGGFAAASTIHINLFGPHPIVVKGSPEQKEIGRAHV